MMSGKSYFAADVPEVVLKNLFRKYDTDDSKSLGKREMLRLLKEDLGFEDDRAQACILMVDKEYRSTNSSYGFAQKRGSKI